MTIRKALLCVSVGFIIAILAIGLLPFLAVFSWTEELGITDVSPLAFLGRFYKKDRSHSEIGEDEDL
ncbi:hypothetical protein [Paenibacillus sp. HB172176]|uniref:hypothetical protein n=1 Tax=Paenibacillus sp. HB172176 TaxID=2493690 RepID=UPI0014389552|nr:hypothetical protein [Paenibacillus sp. HB172176]